MPDPIELLAAANPVEDCPSLPFAVLERAMSAKPRQRDQSAVPQRRLALGGSALAVGAAVTVIIFIALSSGPSIVSRAYAATANTASILHYTVTAREVVGGISDGKAVHGSGPVSTSDVWSSGPRWHSVAFTPKSDGRYDQTGRSTVELAVDGATVLRFSSQTPKTIERLTVPRTISGHRGSRSACNSVTFELAQSVCGDPIRQLHSLLRTKQLKLTGTMRFGARQVDVLTGSPRDLQGAVIRSITVRVLLNPRTFVPLQVRATQLIANHPGVGGRGYVLTSTTDTETFSSFQRLKLTPRNLTLLNLRPHPGATVVVTPIP